MRLLAFTKTAFLAGAALISCLCLAQAETDLAEADVLDPVNLGWDTVWYDDFEQPGLDPSKWRPEESCWGGGNNERQCYTARPENVRVENGVLHLVARPESYTGPLYPEGFDIDPAGEHTQPFTSGKVRTRGLAAWKYGRISARIKLPDGQGTWPAFWMMPEVEVYGGWPLSGEIDIMEAVNLGTPCDECPGGVERRTSGALHFGDAMPGQTYLFNKIADADGHDPTQEWQVYAIEWAEGTIQWLVDGEVYLRLNHTDWYTTAPEAAERPYAPFDQPFYLMINLAVGGDLSEKSNGAGFDPGAFPAEVQVDWVRVEQCGLDAETGRACLSQQTWDGVPQGPWEGEVMRPPETGIE